MTNNPLSSKTDKSRLEEDRLLTESKPLWMIYLAGAGATICSESLREGTLPGQESAIGKRAAAGPGLALFSLHSQLKKKNPSEDTQRKRFLIYIKIVCRTGNSVHESVSKLRRKKEPKHQKTSKKTVKLIVKYN